MDVTELVGFELKNNKAEIMKHNLYLQNAQQQIFSQSYHLLKSKGDKINIIKDNVKVFKPEPHKNADAFGEVGVFNSNLFQMRHEMSNFQGCDMGIDGENKSNGGDFEGNSEPPKNIYNKRSSLFKNGSKLFFKGFYVAKGKLPSARDTSSGLYPPTDRSNEGPRISQGRFGNSGRDLSSIDRPFGK